MAPQDGDGKVRLAFERLHYTVNVKGSDLPKALLQNINGDVTSGHVLAILGPSGAGKTTLLNTLTLQQAGGAPSGYIRVNGEPLTTSIYDRVCAYVEQFDTLWASLTAREHLEYAMSLHRGDLDVTQRAAEIDELLRSVGLEDFQHTRAGSEISRGLSSGNKRRLSVALALVKRPKILFLDEPTSGVDSASAVRMMTFLKKVAKEQKIAVVCTIHQPPASVFAGFDNVMVLSMGRVAISAKPQDERISLWHRPRANRGYQPRRVHPRSRQQGFHVHRRRQERARQVVRRHGRGVRLRHGEGRRRRVGVVDGERAPSPNSCGSHREERPRGEARTLRVPRAARRQLRRHAVLRHHLHRDSGEGAGADQPQDLFLMFCVGIPMQFILVSNFIYHYQWLSLKKEVKDGMYHPAQTPSRAGSCRSP